MDGSLKQSVNSTMMLDVALVWSKCEEQDVGMFKYSQ